MRLFHRFRIGIAQNYPGRLLNSNLVHERFHPRGWEPEVLQCLMDGDWNGPIWDVGASFGRHSYRLARRHQVIAFEPNLNSLAYLGYNLRHASNVLIVPCALTPHGKPMKGTYHADFVAPPTGPDVATLSVEEAFRKFGTPGVVKLDIEGGEYELLESDVLRNVPLVVEWHREVPQSLEHWDVTPIDRGHTLLLPKSGGTEPASE